MSLASKEDLAGFLEGKSVALVGPSPHLEGESMGARIDAHDVEARVNEIDSSNNAMDYGSRTDMAFFNFAPDAENKFNSIIAYSEIHPSLVWLVCPRPSRVISLTYLEKVNLSHASLKIVFLDGVDLPHITQPTGSNFPHNRFLINVVLDAISIMNIIRLWIQLLFRPSELQQ